MRLRVLQSNHSKAAMADNHKRGRLACWLHSLSPHTINCRMYATLTQSYCSKHAMQTITLIQSGFESVNCEPASAQPHVQDCLTPPVSNKQLNFAGKTSQQCQNGSG
eukprot:1463277-Amphidinium_carterae.2